MSHSTLLWSTATGTLVALAAFAEGSAAHAVVATFDLSGTPTSQSSSSITYQSNGFTLTIQPGGSGNPVINKTANGPCVFSDYGATAGTPATWCGQAFGSVLNNLSWTVTSPNGLPVRYVSYSLKGVTTFNGVGEDTTPYQNDAVFDTFWSGTSSFSDSRTVFAADQGSATSGINVNFASTFIEPTNSSVSVLTTNNSGTPLSYRIQSFSVEEVPGPLPLLGALSAFAYARKIKSKIARID
jgi:hypothetical protein